ncbi:MAG TPA: hypothetical protein DD381_10270 [Lentisphaeria bacterium]|nr:MAG: hypothetical protein A2X47_12045 [Lentisphaerae bacterium GWF2_38_69]HBM16710.1 hypothetical protein [Lentisphaeria bacterium]
MQKESWRIWAKDESVEQRTYKRVTGELPEMECTKQLVELISNIYLPGMSILDVGCAAGHYYNGLKRIDPDIKYSGIDATIPYITFAKNYFKNNTNTSFAVEDIFNLPVSYELKYDIVYCCNVILHLPCFQTPLKNIIKSSKKYCFIRTLISDKTHLSKFLYSDTFNDKGEPLDFVYQNTYSFSILENFIHSLGNYTVEFLEDKFDSEQINSEYKNYSMQQDAVTKTFNNIQIAGSKVFEWRWIKITK